MKIAALEADHKIQLPAEWLDELGLHGFAELEKGPEGIFVRRCTRVTWDEVFADKLPIGSHAATPDLSKVRTGVTITVVFRSAKARAFAERKTTLRQLLMRQS